MNREQVSLWIAGFGVFGLIGTLSTGDYVSAGMSVVLILQYAGLQLWQGYQSA